MLETREALLGAGTGSLPHALPDSSPVQAKVEARDGRVHHNPSPPSFCPYLLRGMSWKKWSTYRGDSFI